MGYGFVEFASSYQAEKVRLVVLMMLSILQVVNLK